MREVLDMRNAGARAIWVSSDAGVTGTNAVGSVAGASPAGGTFGGSLLFRSGRNGRRKRWNTSAPGNGPLGNNFGKSGAIGGHGGKGGNGGVSPSARLALAERITSTDGSILAPSAQVFPPSTSAHFSRTLPRPTRTFSAPSAEAAAAAAAAVWVVRAAAAAAPALPDRPVKFRHA